MSVIRKVGLYAGTFDPIHEGHVSLMRQAVDQLELEIIYCLPDRSPRIKKNVVELVHRESMIRLATDDIKEVQVPKINTDYASFPETINELSISDLEVYILMGSDAAIGMSHWRNAQQMVKRSKFVVGVRTAEDAEDVRVAFQAFSVSKDHYLLIETPYAALSSSRVRAEQQNPHPKIAEYIRKHRLYKV